MYHVFGEILMQVELKYRCLHWKGVWKHLIIGKASVFLNCRVLFASKAKWIPPRN